MLPSRFLYDSMFGLDRMEDMSCDIYEQDNKYHLEMDIPGFTNDDIKIECHKGTITVSAKKNVETEEKDEDKKYIRRERKYGEYKRSFYLGDIDEDAIKAEFKNGTLLITAPIKTESLKKEISIESEE